MSRTYRKRPIYDNKDHKFGGRFKSVNGEVVETGTSIPAKRKVNHYEVEVPEVRVLRHDKREIDVRHVPEKVEEDKE